VQASLREGSWQDLSESSVWAVRCRTGSTSRTALETALDGAQAANAEPSLIWVRDLDLPMYTPERAVPAGARELADTVHGSDALIWSTPTYHSSVSGSFKNALDWLILLAERDPP
jgi:NAD(P)H-dependent FMN reductase